jgi:hypothetical protein
MVMCREVQVCRDYERQAWWSEGKKEGRALGPLDTNSFLSLVLASHDCPACLVIRA